MLLCYYLEVHVIILFWNVLSCLSEPETFNELSLPVIIWWTDILFPHLEKESRIHCSSGDCIALTKRKYENNSNITYLFYGTDFDPEILPLPRKNNHLWALFHEESPMNNYMLSHTPGITLFNFTSTFSKYSDHPLTTQFIPSLKYFTERKPVLIDEKNKLRKKGFAPVMYLQSHCNVASDRDSYVKELMNFIDVDSYGNCLHNKNLPDHLSSTETYNSDNLFSFISKYKFHIAFENALCEDYITEKLYRALYVGSVPIYKGSSTVKEWVSSNYSVIIADDFTSPMELANYISILDQNDTLYNQYLEYKKSKINNPKLDKEISKRTWGVNDIDKIDFIHSFECYMCDKMYNLNSNIHIANKKHMNCPQPHPSVDQTKVNEKWLQEEWIENYWFAYDKAKAVQMMLLNKDKDTSNFMKYILKQKYENS